MVNNKIVQKQVRRKKIKEKLKKAKEKIDFKKRFFFTILQKSYTISKNKFNGYYYYY